MLPNRIQACLPYVPGPSSRAFTYRPGHSPAHHHQAVSLAPTANNMFFPPAHRQPQNMPQPQQIPAGPLGVTPSSIRPGFLS